MNESRIRRATAADTEALSDLDNVLFDNGLGPYTIERELAAGFGLVTEGTGGEIEGYALVRTGPLADITRIGVRESSRGRGVGRALLTAALEVAGGGAMLTVRACNGLAGRMYERAGFEIVAWLDGPAWIMRRQAPPKTTASPNSDASGGAST